MSNGKVSLKQLAQYRAVHDVQAEISGDGCKADIYETVIVPTTLGSFLAFCGESHTETRQYVTTLYLE